MFVLEVRGSGGAAGDQIEVHHYHHQADEHQLHRIERKVDHLTNMVHELLQASVDPAKLVEATARLEESRKRLAAVSQPAT